jgi:hypothetical protein
MVKQNYLSKKDEFFNSEEKRKSQAKYILSLIKKSKSNWFCVEMIRNLHFYIEYDFVKQELKEIYISKSSIEIREAIRGLHDGTIDVSDLMEQINDNKRLYEETKINQEKFYSEYIEPESQHKEKIPNASNLPFLRYQSRINAE